MSVYNRSSEKRRIYHEFRRQEEEVIGSLCRLGSRPSSPKSQLEQEKRIRREIANSNERRRMQSINAGFQSLRTLLPHHEGEKLSKAAILQHTSEFIYQLEQEKTRLLTQNCHLKRLLNHQLNPDSDASSLDSPLPKRKKPENAANNHGATSTDFEVKKHWKAQAESSDEGIGNMSPSGKEPTMEDLRRELLELRVQLDRERRLRMVLEDQNHSLQEQSKITSGETLLSNNNKSQMEIAYPYLTTTTTTTGEEAFLKEAESADLLQDALQDHDDVKEEEEEMTQNDNVEYKCISLITTSSVDEIPEDLSSSTPKTIIVTNSVVNNMGEEYEIEQECPMNTPCISIPSPTHPSPSDSPMIPLNNNVNIIHNGEIISSEISISSLASSNNVLTVSPQQQQQQATSMHVVSQQQPRLYHASTSRQNLETIVEAIRHLEGDHLFRDDPKPDVVLTEMENDRSNNVLSRDVTRDTAVTHEQASNGNLESVVALQNGGHEYVRKQIIHTMSGNSTRPGVIVSNHT